MSLYSTILGLLIFVFSEFFISELIFFMFSYLMSITVFSFLSLSLFLKFLFFSIFSLLSYLTLFLTSVSSRLYIYYPSEGILFSLTLLTCLWVLALSSWKDYIVLFYKIQCTTFSCGIRLLSVSLIGCGSVLNHFKYLNFFYPFFRNL